jgi:methylmalonyl-CoA/ethylmalonyl-CoA epimerase
MRFKHLGVAVANIQTALELYRDLFGYTLLSGPFDDPVHCVSVCFIGTENSDQPIIELVAPFGDSSPVKQILAKGIAAYHVCYEVQNMDEVLKHARATGCTVLTQPLPAVAFQARRIAWFYTPTRQLVEVLEQ